MALRDWVRHEGDINIPFYSTSSDNNEDYIMIIRDIQYQDIQQGSYTKYPTLYDVAMANTGKNYIHVTDNTKLQQDPPKLNRY